MKRTSLIALSLLPWLAMLPDSMNAAETQEHELYSQKGTDPTFKELVEKKKLPDGKNSKEGITGSKIDVNNRLVETLPESKRDIPRAIKLHTLLNSAIPRADFGEWTRWYQEDGNTQIFRLFQGEENRHNARDLAARVETFSELKWTAAEGKWHEWSGVVTAVKPTGSIFQVKSLIEGPAVMILMSGDGDVKVNQRRGEDKVIAKNMIAKPFHLRVRDNGRNFEVFYNEKMVSEGMYERPKSPTSFRWGMYVGTNEVKEDALIFFSGVTIDGKK
jgi:hypothetical protein